MNVGCCMTDANGQEYPGAPLHDADCPVGGTGSNADDQPGSGGFAQGPVDHEKWMAHRNEARPFAHTERTTAPMSDYTDGVFDRIERRAAQYVSAAPDFDDYGAGDPSMDDAFPPSARPRSRTTERKPMTTSLALPPISADLAKRIENAWAKAAPAVRDKSTIESIPEPPEGAVITFSKRYATSPKTYLFAAIKIKEDEWSLTGRETKSMTWVQLLQFIGGGQDDGLGLRTVRIATEWVGVADDE